jgi:hypothetical protein
VLRWIETPVDSSGLGRYTGQGGIKEIISLSFGIDGETDLPIGTEADISGKIPILVILPEGTGLTELIPLVTYTGKSLNPPSGKTGDFTNPVVYTVTAEDGTTRDYIVRVYEKGPSAKEIIRFTIDIFREGGSPLGAEGIIDQDAGIITVTVPAGTALTGLTAHITHTGIGVIGPLGGYHPDETFSFHGDFSKAAVWTALARDESTKTYTVQVIREKSGDKEITAFSLGLPGETDIIGAEPRSDGVYPILALVPNGSALTRAAGLTAPFISYRGAAISPEDKPLDFDTPVRYTVAAEDGTTRTYEVQVICRHGETEKLITGFYLQNPLVEGVIDQAAHSVAITVPAGTDVSALRPEIYYKGVSVSPMSGQARNFTTPVIYMVLAADGTDQPYTVSVLKDTSIPPVVDAPGGGKVDVGVGTDGKPLVFVEFPTYIYSPTINISYPGGNTYNYYDYQSTIDVNMKVIVLPPAPPAPADPLSSVARIDAFYFTGIPAIGDIDQNLKTIAVTVPYSTDLRNLTATLVYTGKEIVGHPGETPLKDGPRSFTSAVSPSTVTYTVNPYSGTSETYTLTITVADNPAKDITKFSFSEGAPTNVIISPFPNADGEYPIDVTIPSTLTISALTPVITYTGSSISGNNITTGTTTNPATASTTINFTWSAATPPVPPSVKYEITAADGTTKTYTVTVHNAIPGVADPKILGFYFTSPLAVGVVNQDANAITVTVPPGTNTRALTPTIYFEGVSVRPGSGTVNNFSSPVIYTVTNAVGTPRSYLVTVTAAPSSAKDITAFKFPAAPGAETVIGAVPDPDDGTYPLAVWVPAGTSLGSLVPVITHTGVGISPPSGTALSFNTPQTYTVTAEDGSTKTYRVTVNTRDDNAKNITSFVFNEVPLGTSSPYDGYVRAVGSVDQTGHTIKVLVPNNADITTLAPTITYIGKSITEPAGTEQTTNPFDGTGKNFSTPQTYIVKDRDGGTQGYIVTVTKQSPVDVDFDGERDIAVAGSVFDPGTGIVTVTVDTGKVSAPYEWYVDGILQAAAGNVFTLNVGNGFTPGRHEIMVSGIKDGLHYTSRVSFTVSR